MADRRFGFLVALLVFGLDQLVKWWVTGPLGINHIGDEFYIVPFFQFTYTQNIGISLGLLNATTEVGRWMLVGLTSAIAIGVAYWLGREKNRIDQVALGMVLGGALGAELVDRHLVLVELLLAILLLDLPLDREAVAVPAGNVGRILAEQGLGADDHVLERVVERMADVDVAVGVGRTVVKDELLAASAAFTDLPVQPLGLPARCDPRLLLRQPRLHREVGARQEDGRTVVGLGGLGSVGHYARGLSG